MQLVDAISELAEYRCLDLTEKVTFLGNMDDIDVIGGFYDIFEASLTGYEGVVAVKCSAENVLEVSTHSYSWFLYSTWHSYSILLTNYALCPSLNIQMFSLA